jgi:hypothetical protein
MTDYERIRSVFNAAATCKHGERPQLNYDPGCLYVECSKGDLCKCRMADGDGIATSAFLAAWREKFGAK